MLLQNVDGDVEGYVGRFLVGRIDNVVPDIEEDILVGCIAVEYVECRFVFRREKGTVIKKIDWDVIGDVVGFDVGNSVVNRIAIRDKMRLAATTWEEHFQKECAWNLEGNVIGDFFGYVIGDVELAACNIVGNVRNVEGDVLGDVIGYVIGNVNIASR